jgi:hypothetical protein
MGGSFFDLKDVQKKSLIFKSLLIILKKHFINLNLKLNTSSATLSFLINAVNRELALDTIYSYEKMPYSILIYNDADSLLYWNNNRVQPYKSDYQFEKI